MPSTSEDILRSSQDWMFEEFLRKEERGACKLKQQAARKKPCCVGWLKRGTLARDEAARRVEKRKGNLGGRRVELVSIAATTRPRNTGGAQ